MSGEYFDPLPVFAKNHSCEPPDSRFAPSKYWRCECGRAWVRRELYQHGEYWFQWERAPEYDEEK
jgi:hypothetical protein